jgi:hypothetical protein
MSLPTVVPPHTRTGLKVALYCSECGFKVGSQHLRGSALDEAFQPQMPFTGRVLCLPCRRNWGETCSW